MDQAMLQWAPVLEAPLAAPSDSSGFKIGWDHAQHGLVPPADLLTNGTSVDHGWRAGKAVFGRRTLTTTRSTRTWLTVRTDAWQRGMACDEEQVTARFIGHIDVGRCPVRRTLLGGACGQGDAPVVERLNPAVGFVFGNLAVLSRLAAAAWSGMDALACLRRSNESGSDRSLEVGAWLRFASLRSFATPLPFHTAARLPLAVLPPRHVHPVNVSQRLQAHLTWLFTTPGWSVRARELASRLPADTVRHDFNLFIGSMAPRALEADQQPAALRFALEDAWLNERVQRRWQHFVLSLGEEGTRSLLNREAVRPRHGGPHGRMGLPETS